MNMPDTRGWIIIGLFGLTFFIFDTMRSNLSVPTMQELFTVLGTAVVSGGLGGAVGYYFGSSKGSTDKDAVTAAAVSKLPDAPQ